MIPVIYAAKINTPIEKKDFEFLLKFVRQDKAEYILRQKVKQKADEMLIGEILMMVCVQKTFNIPFHQQKITTDSYGKPYLINFPQIHFNISHSKGFVVCAVCDTPVGVDVQKITRYSPAIAKRICNDDELLRLINSSAQDSDFTKLWTRKESALKLYGTGIAQGNIKNCLNGVIAKSKKIDDFWITVCIKDRL